jgi:hypothetical protein
LNLLVSLTYSTIFYTVPDMTDNVRSTKEVGIGGMWIEKLLGYPEMIQYTLKYVFDHTSVFPKGFKNLEYFPDFQEIRAAQGRKIWGIT